MDFTLGPISLATLAVLNFRMNTRLSSIKSQPKKVVVVVIAVVVFVVVVVVVVKCCCCSPTCCY